MHTNDIALSAIIFITVLVAAWVWRRSRLEHEQAVRAASRPLRGRLGKKREIQRYRDTVDEMDHLIRTCKYDEAYAVARRWCMRAPKFAEEWTALYGAFDLEELPPVEYAAKHLVALRNVPELRQLREIFSSSERLKRWQYLLADEIVAAKELERIYGIVEQHPGIDQLAAAREAGADVRRAISAIGDADVRSLIRRDHEGGRRLLFVS